MKNLTYDLIVSANTAGILCMGSMGNMTAIRNSEYPKIAKACVKALATSPFYRSLNLIRDDFTIFYSGLDSFDAAIKVGIKKNLDGMFTCTPPP